MSKFLVLYLSEGALSGLSVSEMFAKSTPEQMASGMEAWGAWQRKAGSAIVDLGAPVDHSTTVADGSSESTKSAITGFSILQAASMDEAIAIMKPHPHFHMPGSTIQILEYVTIPGM